MLILIVDDHPATVTFMRLALTAAGHTVTTATSVQEAIGCATAERFDVVLSDLTFRNTGESRDTGVTDDTDQDQDRHGCALARTLRALPSTADVGLLAVSGADSPDVVRDTVDSGFDGFVSKPVDLPSLLASIDQLGDLVAARR